VAGVTRIGDGLYRVEVDGRSEIVYVAGRAADSWLFWNGHVFHGDVGDHPAAPRVQRGRTSAWHAPSGIAAPMPATVLKVLVTPGQAIRKGETVIVLEAMKMELPLKALGDGTVTAVRCREGELVQADDVLVEVE
jgi:3-methylcrotonyl-CoA carboxylase alpha subunit